MDVILLQKVANLGTIGDRVKVKSGYGRNFLLPQGKATLATPANVAKFEARRAELEKVARSEVRLPNGPLRVVGEHEVSLHLHTDVNVPLAISIVAEE